MKMIQRHGRLFLMIIVCVILLNQIVFMKYGTNLLKYLQYSSPISKKERIFLEKNTPIRLGTDVTAPPISYYDKEKQKYDGLIVDYVNFLSIETQTPITVDMYTFYHLVEALRERRIDVCDMFPSQNRAKEFDFSIPIYRLKTVVIFPKADHLDLSDLSGKKVAIPKGDLAAEYINDFMKKENRQPVDFVFVNDTKTVLDLLQQGAVDASVGDEAVISTYWKEYEVYETKKYAVVHLYEKDVVLAVNKDNDILLSVLNKGILQMKKNNILSKVQQKWFGISESIRGEKRDLESFINIGIILLLCMMGLYLWNYSLKKNVLQKTKEIERAKENISMILNNLSIALFIVDESYNIMECNQASLMLLSKSRKEVVEKNIFDLPFLSELFQSFDESGAGSDGEHTFRKIIKNRSYEIKLSPNISSDEQFKILSIEDTTERLIIEKKLHQENKMITIGQISAGLAHEIRNPLGVIRNGLYLLKMKVSEESKDKAIVMVEKSIQRIGDLIEHLLRFSKTASHESSPQDLRAIVQNILTLMESRLKSKNVRTEFVLEGNPIMFLNVEALHIILSNLIENAADAFLPESSDNRITIKVKGSDHLLEMSVEDNAAGIAEEDKDLIFEPFYTTKEESYGTGLGLYLVYNEVKKYNGDISVKSTCGVGTVFYISMRF